MKEGTSYAENMFCKTYSQLHTFIKKNLVTVISDKFNLRKRNQLGPVSLDPNQQLNHLMYSLLF